MAAEIVVFTPKAEADASVNLSMFITTCREQLTIFGANLPFEDIAWDVSDVVQLKAQAKRRVRIFFSTQETVGAKGRVQMAEPFVSFAKAYVRYMQGMRPTKYPALRVNALRALDAALRESGQSDPVKVDGGTFNRAARIIAEGRLNGTTAYRAGIQLEMIAEFMSEHRLTATPLSWRNCIKRPADVVRVGREFDRRRAEKMPSSAALEAVAKAFHIATEPYDKLFSSIAAILCSAPERINEVLLLAENCEVHDRTSSGKDAYGLRWLAAKGAEPTVKWVVPSMVPVVQEAVSRIRRLTDAARRIARWYEAHPRTLYLPPELEHLRGRELVTMTEVQQILWLDSRNITSPYAWCRRLGLQRLKLPGTMGLCVRLADVERTVVDQLPVGFPLLNAEIGLKYSDALIVVRRNELHPYKGTSRCVIDPVTIEQVNSALGARTGHGFNSIFSRLGFTEPDGSAIRVTTHQFRHYLNTLAQAGGMSQLDIAKWSGRIHIRQNEAYDHVSAGQMVAKIRQAIGDESQMFGPLATLPKNIPISRDEFARLKIPTAHTTDFGFCVHDYTMTPCEQHADCINCNEHVCVKGDDHRAAMVKRRLAEAQGLLERAKAATEDGYYGADRWMEHHQRTVVRLTQLVAILDDVSVPKGAVIQLSGVPTISRIQQALADRAAFDGKSSVDLLAVGLDPLPEG